MREPDLHYETHISLEIEDATQNLSENLHLKWSYGLLFVDKYSTENGLPVSVISGIRREDETTHYMRIHLISEQKGVYARIDVWRVVTSGWPFPTMAITSPKTDKLVDIVDDIMEFCQQAYDSTGGVFPWLKTIFSGKAETRKYED